MADEHRHYARHPPRMFAPCFVDDERQQNATLCFCSICALPGVVSLLYKRSVMSKFCHSSPAVVTLPQPALKNPLPALLLPPSSFLPLSSRVRVAPRLIACARAALLLNASQSSPSGCICKASVMFAGCAVEQVLPLTLGALYACCPRWWSGSRSPAC